MAVCLYVHLLIVGPIFVPYLPPAPGLLLCQLRAVGTVGFTKTPNNQRGRNCFFLSTHKLILWDKSQKTKVQLFALSPRPCSAVQGSNLSLNLQLQLNRITKSVCLTSSLALLGKWNNPFSISISLLYHASMRCLSVWLQQQCWALSIQQTLRWYRSFLL